VPEVGGDLCRYGDPKDMRSFSAGITALLTDAAALRASAANIRASPLRDWSAVTRDIAAHVLHHIAGS